MEGSIPPGSSAGGVGIISSVPSPADALQHHLHRSSESPAETGTPAPLLSLNQWTAVVFAMGAIAFAGAVAFLRLGLHTCGGDAGVGAPPLSHRGRFCDAGAPIM